MPRSLIHRTMILVAAGVAVAGALAYLRKWSGVELMICWGPLISMWIGKKAVDNHKNPAPATGETAPLASRMTSETWWLCAGALSWGAFLSFALPWSATDVAAVWVAILLPWVGGKWVRAAQGENRG